MKRETAEKLKPLDISVEGRNPHAARLMFPGGRKQATRIESCVLFRDGMYDIESIGGYTYMGGRSTFMRHVRSIGRFCSIAADINAGQVEHPTDFVSTASALYGDWTPQWPSLKPFYDRNQANVKQAIGQCHRQMAKKAGKIVVGNDVWIGYAAYISRGVTIGNGAVIAAHAVVTRDVPPYAIVAGVPAKVVRYRFDEEIIACLERLQWWDYGVNALEGVSFENIRTALDQIEANIVGGAQRWRPAIALVTSDETVAIEEFPADSLS